MPSTTGSQHSKPALSEDDIDDILYYARAGELESLSKILHRLTNHDPDNIHAVNNIYASKNLKALSHDIILASKDSNSGNSVLHLGAANGHTNILTYILSLNLYGPLGPHPQINVVNNAGNTPLHWACLNGHLGIVKLLLEYGADSSIRNMVGNDALYEAEVGGNDEVVQWLLEMGKGLERGVGGGEEDGEEEVGDEGVEEGKNEVDVEEVQCGVERMSVGGKEGLDEEVKKESGVAR
ncbi:MAG: hypothetical protein M1812_000288 [Candelaria pacifica]|nr:MAG: hypothetical protein M1812_000288 [Candelaria pacifica]